jgi:hypothetical protein
MEVTKWLKPSDSVSRYTVTARGKVLHCVVPALLKRASGAGESVSAISFASAAPSKIRGRAELGLYFSISQSCRALRFVTRLRLRRRKGAQGVVTHRHHDELDPEPCAGRTPDTSTRNPLPAEPTRNENAQRTD